VVFVLLIVPAFLALLQSRFQPLGFAWVLGSLLIITALIVSYQPDLPTGYTIVFIASLVGVVSALIIGKKAKVS